MSEDWNAGQYPCSGIEVIGPVDLLIDNSRPIDSDKETPAVSCSGSPWQQSSMWPSENPWPMAIICLSALVCFVIAWTNNRKTIFLVGAATFLLLIVGVFAIDRSVVTPTEQVRENVLGITRAFQARELEKVYSYISDSAWDVRLLAAYGYNNILVRDDMRVTDIQIRMLANNQRISSRFRVNGTVTYDGNSMRASTMWDAKWQPEPDKQDPAKTQWKMIEIVALDPITEEPQDHLEGIRERVLRQYPRNP